MLNRYTFPKSEKLCGKLRIKTLYDKGKRFTCYPLRVTWHAVPVVENVQPPLVLLWAPKSLFRHAVTRNRLRRIMREAYRLNCLPLKQYCTENNISLQIAFNYITKEELEYQQIDKAMLRALTRLINELSTLNT